MFVFDAHIDTLMRLIDCRETLEDAQGHVSLSQLVQGRGAQFFAAFVDPKYYHGLAMHRTVEMIDLFWQILDDHRDVLAFAGSAKDITEANSQGRFACLLAIEGGERWKEAVLAAHVSSPGSSPSDPDLEFPQSVGGRPNGGTRGSRSEQVWTSGCGGDEQAENDRGRFPP